MKRLIAALLLVAMLLPAMVACGATESTSDDAKDDNADANTNNDDNSGNENVDGDDDVVVKDPVLSIAETTALGVNQVLAPKMEFVPVSNTDKLTFVSSDPEVVACNNEEGTLTGLKEGTATITITNSNGALSATTTVTVTDPLKGATAAFFGDSICMASTHDKEHQWWGWAGRIKETYGLATALNKGVDGASLSTCRPTNRIVNQVKSVAGTKYDFIVLHGGTNDGMDSAPIGVMSDSFDVADFDTTTFAGGLEELFYNARKYNPSSYICYIINFKIEATGWGPLMTVRGMAPYYALAKQICKKWNIPYLDLFSDAEFGKAFKHTSSTLVPDGVHPSSAGYDIIYPFIAEFMRQVSYGLDVSKQK